MTLISLADLGLAPLDKVVKMRLLSLARYASSWNVYQVRPEESDQSDWWTTDLCDLCDMSQSYEVLLAQMLNDRLYFMAHMYLRTFLMICLMFFWFIASYFVVPVR